MEHFIVNLGTTNVRREKLLGRNYLVVPATILSPGVLNGSKGPLYYPPDEISANPMVWNGTPITVGHPQLNGIDVSAKEPGILEKYGVGWVFNDKAENGQRKVEAWFDEELLKNKAPSTYYKILAGKPEELSTGLKTDNYPVKTGSTFNGRPYTHIARNYRPDHLAILPHEKGACSIADGCGVLVNGEYIPVLDQLNTDWIIDGDTIDRVSYEGQELWQLTTNRMSYDDDEEDDEDTTDNRKGKGSMPSKGLDMSPAKACQILKDGTVHGQPLTSHQRGMFGALCGQMKPTKNMNPKGCNQWTGAGCSMSGGQSHKWTDKQVSATKAASKASSNTSIDLTGKNPGYALARKAAKSEGGEPTAKLHDQAAKAHKKSYESLSEAGHTTRADSHYNAFQAHVSAAQAHRSGTTSNSTEEQGTANGVNTGKEGCNCGNTCEQCKVYEAVGITANSEPVQIYHTIIGLFKKLNHVDEVINMDRTATISWLTTNCTCWKDKQETLNKLTDEELKSLKDGYEKFVQDKTLLQNQLTTVTNKLKEVEQKSTPAPAPAPGAPVVTNEWWKPMGFSSQEHAVAVLNTAKNVEAEKRAQLAAQLTVNIKDPAARQAKAEKLLTKSVEELADMLELMPTGNSSANGTGDPAQRLLPMFFGAAGGAPTTNRVGPELPVLDLNKEREKYDPWVLNKVVKAS